MLGIIRRELKNAIWCKFQVTNRKMKKYEKEYLLKKEQEAQLEDPVERLQVRNFITVNRISAIALWVYAIRVASYADALVSSRIPLPRWWGNA